MKINDKVYDVLKWVLLTFVPALLIFIPSLSELYGWDTVKLVQTIALVAELIGTVLGIGSVTYAKTTSTETSKVVDPYQLVGEEKESEE